VKLRAGWEERMADTYYDRLKNPDAGKTIEDLCRPLSAKILPARAMTSLVGTLSEQQALANQRRTTRNGPARSR